MLKLPNKNWRAERLQILGTSHARSFRNWLVRLLFSSHSSSTNFVWSIFASLVWIFVSNFCLNIFFPIIVWIILDILFESCSNFVAKFAWITYCTTVLRDSLRTCQGPPAKRGADSRLGGFTGWTRGKDSLLIGWKVNSEPSLLRFFFF